MYKVIPVKKVLLTRLPVGFVSLAHRSGSPGCLFLFLLNTTGAKWQQALGCSDEQDPKFRLNMTLNYG